LTQIAQTPMRGRRGWERRLNDATAATPGRRIPNLSGLPPLLESSGAFKSLRERLTVPRPPAGAARYLRASDATLVPLAALPAAAPVEAAPAADALAVVALLPELPQAASKALAPQAPSMPTRS